VTTFRERLQRAAKHAGVGETQAEIADNLGISRQTVHYWFKNGGADAANLALIERRWGVNGEWLRSADGDMLPQPSPGDLPSEELELLRDYRKASAQAREHIRTVARALRKSVITLAAVIPPLLASPDTDAAVLHKQNCGLDLTGIRIAFLAWLKSLFLAPRVVITCERVRESMT
jgi:AcrR family transcriptional regulator